MEPRRSKSGTTLAYLIITTEEMYMIQLTRMNAFYRRLVLSFLTILTASLVACNPAGDQSAKDPGATKISPLSEKEAICEAKIRKQMEDKSLQLSVVGGLETQIIDANKLIAKTNATSYSLMQKTQITSIKLVHTGISTPGIRVKYDLSKNGDEATTDMNLTLEIENIQARKVVSIKQQFSISDSCALSVTSTASEVLQNTENNNYTYSKDSFYQNGETQNESDKFTVAQNAKLTNLMPEIHSINDVPAQSLTYIPKTGVVTVTINKRDTRAVKEFGLDLVFESQDMGLVVDGKLLFTIKVGVDKSKAVTVSEFAKQKTWTLPKSVWQGLALGHSRDLNSLIISELSQDYLKTHNSIQLLTEKDPAYPHFQAYWQMASTSVDEKSKLKVFTLIENENPIYSDKANSSDLISNDTIQTELPQIQIIAKEILSQTTVRAKQIQLILAYLKKNYIFDHEMLKNNTVRSLSTQEALARGKGVCQHYAVIFTAIARALKIPTRIVVGFLLGDAKARFHAWVETEIQPNVWRVIEPQSPDSLTGAFTRFYIPTGRALYLEDKNQGSMSFLSELISNTYTIKQVP